ncbi:MAG: efflux RND transporter permease subunit [Rhodomicrobium sp.]
MSLAAFSLRRPYTIFAVIALMCLLAAGAARRMPTDIFPEIDIPVVSVVWTYNGMSAPEIQNRIVALHERQLASLVDDISRIEANSYNGVGVIKVYLHQGADVSRAISQLASSSLVVLKYMPRNITPPLILRYGATDVPIIQISLSSNALTDTTLNDLGQNIIRPDLAVVKGASVPYPYGGKPRLIMVSLDLQAMQARGLTPEDVTSALSHQNVIMPSGDVKMGSKDYAVTMNNSPDAIAAINAFPIKQIDGKTVFVRDVAHVHDGYQVQTNSVSENGLPGALMLVRKTGGVSTLAVIDGVREALRDIAKLMPAGVSLKPIFDQSIFVKAALNSVVMGGMLAAGLTALMILLFLGNWRLTVIILASIPLSIVFAILILYVDGQTLNTMTLGGFALAVGILVDNGTVVIENIERNAGLGKPLEEAILAGTAEVGVPTLLATLSICLVFVPVFLLTGTAKYLFSPLSLSVIVSLVSSLVLSFTLVPLLFKYLMSSQGHAGDGHEPESGQAKPKRRFNPFGFIHRSFERGFVNLRVAHGNALSWMVERRVVTAGFFAALAAASLALYPRLGMDFFPQVDAGQMRLHVRAPPGTRLERTQEYFARVERAIRDIVGNEQIDVILDNIGLPYSGINIALSDTATAGPMDGEILIALKEKHTPTAGHMAALRRELPRRFPQLQVFFQPADIVNQVLNFGQPAPIDIRVSGANNAEAFAVASKLARDLNRIPGVVDSHVFQVPDAPAQTVEVNREFAGEVGLGQQAVADNMLVSLNNSLQVAPNFWLSPRTGVSYPLVVQTPTYRINSAQDLWTLPVTSPQAKEPQLLMNIAKFGRSSVPMVMSQLNIRPVYDVNADVQGRDLDSAATAIQDVIAADRPDPSKGITVTLSGQIETMQESFDGLFSGMALAVVLVFLLLVINFQSVIDPLIVLMAVPFALCGAMWMLFVTGTHISVPALMGTLMCIGLTTANSILVVTFCNQRVAAGVSPRLAAVEAGFTRLRPVLMTAGAMILGMIPMALGIGEGGEQNAPLARAVIGGLLFATFATLLFVPTLYSLLRRAPKPSAETRSGAVVPV